MLPGLSTLEPTLTALNLKTIDTLQIVYAAQLAQLYHPPLETGRPALVTHLVGQTLAVKVKQTLLNAYAENLPVTLVHAAGSEAEQVWTCLLSDLDRQPRLEEMTMLYLPDEAGDGSFSSFQNTIAHLRAPEGCPWDREQTHLSLRPYLLEETYEVLEALDAGDSEALAEELGDLLLQILLHTQIATEHGEFKMADVIGHINRKLWRRHPHVFGNVQVNDVDEVITNWETIKRAEKRSNNGPDGESQPTTSSVLAGVPQGMPALAQALAISKRAVRVGFEWPDIGGVLDKVIEEAREIAAATTPDHLEAEIGDLLFSAVNLARWQGVDPESALRATNARFTHRFKILESLAATKGKNVSDMSIEELDVLWEQAKDLAQ